METKFNILFVPLPPIISSFLLQGLYCFSGGPVGEELPLEALGAFLEALNYCQYNFTLICLFYPLDCESPESRNWTFYLFILCGDNSACPTGGTQ